MAEVTMNDLATKGQGTATTVLSAITTGLLALGNGGGLSGLFGGSASATANENTDLKMKVAALEAEKYSDSKDAEIFKVLREQDKIQDKAISDINGRVLALETAGPLKEQIVDQKIARVADTMTCCCNTANNAIAGLQKTLDGITALYVPASQVTPLPMMRYNFWQAPTEPATATAAGK